MFYMHDSPVLHDTSNKGVLVQPSQTALIKPQEIKIREILSSQKGEHFSELL